VTVDDRKLAHLREQCEFCAISDDRRVEWWQLVELLAELEVRRKKDEEAATNGR
jgi:hypothetical protein